MARPPAIDKQPVIAAVETARPAGIDLRDLNFRQFEVFAAVMSEGSITSAARKLGFSQPTVTRLVREFESVLGFELFHRNGPRMSPTTRGISFHEEVEGLLSNLTQMKGRIDAIREQVPRRAVIAATPALAITMVPVILARMEQAALTHDIAVNYHSTERLTHVLLSRAADIGLASYPIEHDGIELHWAAEAPCALVLCEKHRLASQARIKLADLAGERIILAAAPYRHRAQVLGALKDAGISDPSTVETNSSIAAVNLVRNGLGVALIEPVTSWALGMPGVVTRPIDRDILFSFGVIGAQSAPLSPLAHEMIASARDVAMELIPQLRLV